ncbi:hypothetical protein [Rhizobium sullae]|uniref:hypothetical protein n=1 Tax=Rhizobium sullae TaxID=50338 RepID=UPI001AECED2B|nr:hypothetical protein [Rhizobium sullae]
MARDDFEDRRERQRQGIELAKASGKYAGRQADLVTHERIIALPVWRQQYQQDCETYWM